MTTTRASRATLDSLAHTAYRIRRYALRMGEVQGQSYIGQALRLAQRQVRAGVPD